MGSFQFGIQHIDIWKGMITISCLNVIKNELNNLDISFKNKKSFSIGRKNTNDFYYDDQHLSGIHAKINFLNGVFIL